MSNLLDWEIEDTSNSTPQESAKRLEKLNELKVLRQQVIEAEANRLRRRFDLEPHQIPPPGDWRIWLLNAGRGAGKSFAAAYWLDQHVNGPPCDDRIPGGHQVSIVAPTLGDAVESCVEGPSGLKSINPGVRLVHGVAGAHVVWPNGTRGRVLGAHNPEDVERLRASGNRCAAYLEELAAWVRLDGCLDNLLLGLRVGPKPQAVASTTPKPKKRLKELMEDPRTAVSTATTFSNPHLSDELKADLRRRYEGTRIGRQELMGEFLEDVEGALWSWDLIEKAKQHDGVPMVETPDGLDYNMLKICVGVDPAFSRLGDEAGIVGVGVDKNHHGWLLSDVTGNYTSDGWARAAVETLHSLKGNHIVVETNLGGGEFTKNVIWTVDSRVRVETARASRGKALRAEPVVGLYEQGRFHHAGNFPKLEEELTLWTPDSGFSPGRIDALVYAVTNLMVTDPPVTARTSGSITKGLQI